MSWIKHSNRWSDKLFNLQKLKGISSDKLVDGLGHVALCLDDEFKIADG